MNREQKQPHLTGGTENKTVTSDWRNREQKQPHVIERTENKNLLSTLQDAGALILTAVFLIRVTFALQYPTFAEISIVNKIKDLASIMPIKK